MGYILQLSMTWKHRLRGDGCNQCFRNKIRLASQTGFKLNWNFTLVWLDQDWHIGRQQYELVKTSKKW